MDSLQLCDIFSLFMQGFSALADVRLLRLCWCSISHKMSSPRVAFDTQVETLLLLCTCVNTNSVKIQTTD